MAAVTNEDKCGHLIKQKVIIPDLDAGSLGFGSQCLVHAKGSRGESALCVLEHSFLVTSDLFLFPQ